MEIINEKQAAIFTATFCKHSETAKQLLDKNSIPYNEVALDEVPGLDQMEVANCLYGDSDRYVPLIFVNQ